MLVGLVLATESGERHERRVLRWLVLIASMANGEARRGFGLEESVPALLCPRKMRLEL